MHLIIVDVILKNIPPEIVELTLRHAIVTAHAESTDRRAHAQLLKLIQRFGDPRIRIRVYIYIYIGL